MVDITIDSKFNGPSDSGNGGYCCGMFAAQLGLNTEAAIEVTLKSPPPLDRPIRTQTSASGLDVLYGETLVATAQATELNVKHPKPPPMHTAIEASKNYAGFEQHHYPECFVCGTARSAGDGLCIFPGALDDGSQVCAPWRPFPQLANAQGMLRSEFIWAALDCPSYFGAFIGQGSPNALLGKQCLKILDDQISVNEDYIISGWPIGQEGRKCYGGTALFSQSGDCLAIARGTWIILSQ